MADEGIFASGAQGVRKAGLNANSTATSSEALLNDYMAQAESTINILSQVNWSDIYATLNTDTKKILTKAQTADVGNKIIAYDMSGYTSRFEAETILDVNKDDYNVALSLLKDHKKRLFITDPTTDT